jgi:hypothetical protein
MRFLLLVLPFIACGGDKSEEDDTGTIVVKSGSDTFPLFAPEWPR